jgi:hypothetical protein
MALTWGGDRDDTKPRRAQDSLEAFQQQKVWPDERRGEGSSERAIIAGRGNGSVGIALRVILSQISSPLGSSANFNRNPNRARLRGYSEVSAAKKKPRLGSGARS